VANTKAAITKSPSRRSRKESKRVTSTHPGSCPELIASGESVGINGTSF
jgi:hypothetical protein